MRPSNSILWVWTRFRPNLVSHFFHSPPSFFTTVIIILPGSVLLLHYFNDEIRFNYGQPRTKEYRNKSMKKKERQLRERGGRARRSPL